MIIPSRIKRTRNMPPRDQEAVLHTRRGVGHELSNRAATSKLCLLFSPKILNSIDQRDGLAKVSFLAC